MEKNPGITGVRRAVGRPFRSPAAPRVPVDPPARTDGAYGDRLQRGERVSGSGDRKQQDVVDTGTEADGGDEAEEETALGGCVADRLGEKADHPARDDEFHEDEQPSAPEDGRGGKRRREVDDHGGEGGPFSEAEEVDPDGRRDAVEGVAGDGEGADPAGDRHVGPSPPEERPRAGGDEGGPDEDTGRGGDPEGIASEANGDDGRDDGQEDGGADAADERGGSPRRRVGDEPRRPGEDGDGEIDRGRAGERADRGGERPEDIEDMDGGAEDHPRCRGEDEALGDGRAATREEGGDGDEAGEQGEEVGERRESEPLGEQRQAHGGKAGSRRESLTLRGRKTRGMDRAAFAACIDHTVLGPETTAADAQEVVVAAAEYGTNACVPPCYVGEVRAAAPDVTLATVVGFPHGQHAPGVKREEAVAAWEAGADELDVVVNVGRLRAGDGDAVVDELSELVAAVPLPVKVIVEAPLLTEAEKRRAGEAAVAADADYLKTGTGFAGPATVADVELLAEYLPVKASGGIDTTERARAMLDAGAERIGASAGVALVEGFE